MRSRPGRSEPATPVPRAERRVLTGALAGALAAAVVVTSNAPPAPTAATGPPRPSATEFGDQRHHEPGTRGPPNRPWPGRGYDASRPPRHHIH